MKGTSQDEKYNNPQNINLLSEYGIAFQKKLLYIFFKDPVFLKKISSAINIYDHFDRESDKWLIQTFLYHVKKYNTSIDWDSLKVYFTDIDPNEQIPGSKLLLKEAVKNSIKELRETELEISSSSDIQYVKERVDSYCRHKVFKNALNDSIYNLSVGNYQEIYNNIKKAYSFDITDNYGSVYIDTLDSRLNDYRSNLIATPWPVINDLLKGGSSGGELYTFVTPPGGGKTWLLSNIGAKAAELGHSVLHFSLELYENYTMLRYDSIFTNIPWTDIKYHKDIVQARLREINPNIRIISFPPKSMTISKAESVYDNLVLSGFSPAVVIFDYADLIKPENRNDDYRHQLTEIYYGLKDFAMKHNVRVWTASQSNRESINLKIVTGDKISEDINKLAISDFIFSSSSPDSFKNVSITNGHVIKNRFGTDGITFPGRFDRSTGNIQYYLKESIDGMEITKLMQVNEVGLSQADMSFMNKKYKNFKNNNYY